MGAAEATGWALYRGRLLPFQLALLLGGPTCGGAMCPSMYGPGEHSIRVSIPADGVVWEREFVVTVPPTLTEEPAPAMIMWHGCGSDIEKFKLESGMDEHVRTHSTGYYTVWPRGTSSTLGPEQQHSCRSGPDPAGGEYVRCGWNSGLPNAGGCQTPDSPHPDDVDFAERILDWMDSNLCHDRQRTFVVGFSNGAQMVYKLNCMLSQRFAGMMTLGMPVVESTTPGLAECKPQKQIAAINLCGSTDTVSHCFGASGERVSSQLHSFARTGEVCEDGYHSTDCGCEGSAVDVVRTEISSTTFCVKAAGCTSSSPVEACTILGLGHCWPSAAPGQPDVQCQNQHPDNLDASAHILNFFDSVQVAPYTSRRFVYGKYFKAKCHEDSPLFGCTRLPVDAVEDQDYSHNSYWLHSPTGIAPGVKLPIMIQFHGGGFTGGAATVDIDNTIQGYLDNGFHFLSANYRLTNQLYLYLNAAGQAVEEEFIIAGEDGTLTVDPGGTLLSQYAVKVGRTEFNTKCSFDAKQVLEHLISRADELQVDLHKMAFSGSSAGGGEIHYLAWHYHKLEVPTPRYTPVAMAYAGAQLEYPVQNMLDRVWGLWADDVGPTTPLSSILSFQDCKMVVGNPWCDAAFIADRLASGDERWRSSTQICNQQWHDTAVDRYCATEDLFNRATLGDLRATQVWPMDTPQDRGIAKLWYNSDGMQDAASHLDPSRFYMFIANRLNTTAGMDVVHSAMQGRQYARVAESSGMNYAVLYTDYHGMTASDYSHERVTLGDLDYNLLSSFAPAGTGRADWTETKAAFGWQEQIVGECSGGWASSTDNEGTCAGMDSLLFVCNSVGSRPGIDGQQQSSEDCMVPTDLRPRAYTPGSGGAAWRRETIGPEFNDAPEMIQSESIPKGDLYELTFSSSSSNIYPGIAKDNSKRPAGSHGSRFVSIGPLDPSQSFAATYPYERQVVVYVPKQLSRENPAPLIVCQDGLGHVTSIAPTLDSLIAGGRVPPMVAVMINSGGSDAQGSQRGLEYDTIDGLYAAFIESEILPRIAAELGLEFTTDPGARATMGGSSGAAAAFTMAWHRPDLYSKVLSYSGTYVHQQSPYNPASPRGAWEYAHTLIPAVPRKEIRVWMHVSDGDLGAGLPEETLHNWPLANDRMADALEAKEYDYKYTYSTGSGHVDRRVVRQTLAGALAWLWRDSPLLPSLPLSDFLASSGPHLGRGGRQIARSIPGVIDYQLYLPVNYSTHQPAMGWPVVYHLHGSGESQGRFTRGSWANGSTYDEGVNTIESVKAHGIAHDIESRNLPFVVVSPQAPAHANGGWSGSAIDALEHLADTIEATLSVNPRRVYLTGLSMGGSGAWSWAAHNPSRFAAIAPVCGGGGGVGNIDVLVDLPTWAFVGANDRGVGGTDRMVERLRSVNAKELRVTRYSHAPAPNQPTDSSPMRGPASQNGHAAWIATYSDPRLFQWFLEHTSGESPARTTTAGHCESVWAPGEHRIDIETGQPAPFDTRSFLLLIPSQPQSSTQDGRTPSVIDWHGHSESPYYQQILTGVGTVGEEYGWVVAIPFGSSDALSPLCCPSAADGCSDADCMQGQCLDKANACNWNGGPRTAGARRGADDVHFAELIVEWLAANACTDRENVFSFGFSNGASMVLRLGCERADLFRAIAPVAGSNSFAQGLPSGMSAAEACAPSRPIAFLGASGSDDHLEARLDGWRIFAEKNGCDISTPATPTFTSATTSCVQYAGCNSSMVEFCTIAGMRHEWSGHQRPSPNTDPGSQPYLQHASDIDMTQYIFYRFSALVSSNDRTLEGPSSGSSGPAVDGSQAQSLRRDAEEYRYVEVFFGIGIGFLVGAMIGYGSRRKGWGGETQQVHGADKAYARVGGSDTESE